jgi:hypothetical protein
MYDPQNVLLVRENIRLGTTESISFAVEMLDIFVTEELKPKLFPVMDELKVEDKLERLNNFFAPESFESYEDLLTQIVNRDYNRLNRYTKALALHRLGGMSKVVTMDLVANLFNPDYLLLQTAASSMYRIDKLAYQEHTRRLKPNIKKELDKAILPPVFKDEDEVYHQRKLLIERILLLKDMEVFKSIPGVQITYLAENMDEVLVGPEVALIEVGDGGNAPIYVVLEGELDILKDGSVSGNLGVGSIFGEKLLLESDKFDFSVKTRTACKLLVLSKEELLDLMSLHLEIVEAMLHVLKEGAPSIEEEISMEVFV